MKKGYNPGWKKERIAGTPSHSSGRSDRGVGKKRKAIVIAKYTKASQKKIGRERGEGLKISLLENGIKNRGGPLQKKEGSKRGEKREISERAGYALFYLASRFEDGREEYQEGGMRLESGR